MEDGRKIAFVSDFDGTITDKDFFDYTTEAWFGGGTPAPWQAYLDGRLTHLAALREMFAQVRVPADELHALIDSVHVDGRIEEVFRLCHDRGILMYVCSAGNDYYIKRLIGPLLVRYGIRLVANHGSYSEDTGLAIEAPAPDYRFYDEHVGISKYKLVKCLKDEGYFVVFAGDGPPDFEPARIADAVFARARLLDRCEKEGVATLGFDGFADVYDYIRRLA